MRQFQHHHKATAVLPASAAELFRYIDEHARLASHMARRTWRMGGGAMQVQFDAKHGKGIGARIRMCGRVLGRELSVNEIVTVYDPPSRKTWESIGTPKLLVIDAYRMGFEIEARGEQARLCIYIDYDLPQLGVARLADGVLLRALVC